MSARQASDPSGAPVLRSAWPARTVPAGIVLVVIFSLAACVPVKKYPQKNVQDASTYNTQLGIAYLRQGDIPLAKEKLDRALKENPDNPEVHSARAMLFDRMKLPAQAESEFQTALHLSPSDPDISNNYAVYLCQVGRTDDGVRRFEAVARNALYRTPWVAYTNAGVCLRTAKRNTEAARNFQQALQIRPNFGEAAYQLGDLQFNEGDLGSARKTVDTYINAFDPTADLLLLGVRITRAQDDRVTAERLARKLRLDFPNSDQAHALADLDHNPS